MAATDGKELSGLPPAGQSRVEFRVLKLNRTFPVLPLYTIAGTRRRYSPLSLALKLSSNKSAD